jgi:hypothetical protein
MVAHVFVNSSSNVTIVKGDCIREVSLHVIQLGVTVVLQRGRIDFVEQLTLFLLNGYSEHTKDKDFFIPAFLFLSL